MHRDDGERDFDRVEGLAGPGPVADRPFDGDAFNYVEGLVGEEARIEALAAEERHERHHRKLVELRGELDPLHDLLVHRERHRGAS